METHGDVAGLVSGRGTYAVKLPMFEGPLDLLLHLIRQNELTITDVSIGAIADQYLETLELMQELNLEVAAEYLVIAATLAWIKSRSLLPSDEGEDVEDADPQYDLVARLIEYQRFKEVSEQLGERQLLGRDVFRTEVADEGPTALHEREIEVHIISLVEAFKSIVRKSSEATATHEVRIEEITVRERMVVVMDLVSGAESVEFERLFDTPDLKPPSRALLIATFLAVLELVRLAAIRVYQGNSVKGKPEGPIRLRSSDGDGDSWRGYVSEVM